MEPTVSAAGDDVDATGESEEDAGESESMIVEEEKTAEDALPGGSGQKTLLNE